MQTAPERTIGADPWILSSVLQKAIRRGEPEIAQRAAVALFALRGPSIWRRFTVIAFEDVGIGSVNALMTTVAGLDAPCRSGCGGDLRVTAYLARLLAKAAKDRSADYLACAKDHPALAEFAPTIAKAPIGAQLCKVSDTTLDLPHRAIAACFAAGFASSESQGGAKASSRRC